MTVERSYRTVQFRSRRPSDDSDETSRPLGVSVVVIFSLITLLLSWGLLVMTAGSGAGVIVLAHLFFSLVWLLVLYGLWRMEPLAWFITVPLYALTGVGSLVSGNLFGLVSLGVAIYLLLIRDAFETR